MRNQSNQTFRQIPQSALQDSHTVVADYFLVYNVVIVDDFWTFLEVTADKQQKKKRVSESEWADSLNLWQDTPALWPEAGTP